MFYKKNFIKVRKAAKIRNRYNQIPFLTQHAIWESDKTHENITYKKRQYGRQNTNQTYENGSTKEAHPWNSQ